MQVQEYVEAATLCNFCKTGTLLNLSEINASLLPLSDPSIEPLQINVLDYILGVTVKFAISIFDFLVHRQHSSRIYWFRSQISPEN